MVCIGVVDVHITERRGDVSVRVNVRKNGVFHKRPKRRGFRSFALPRRLDILKLINFIITLKCIKHSYLGKLKNKLYILSL